MLEFMQNVFFCRAHRVYIYIDVLIAGAHSVVKRKTNIKYVQVKQHTSFHMQFVLDIHVTTRKIYNFPIYIVLKQNDHVIHSNRRQNNCNNIFLESWGCIYVCCVYKIDSITNHLKQCRCRLYRYIMSIDTKSPEVIIFCFDEMRLLHLNDTTIENITIFLCS